VRVCSAALPLLPPLAPPPESGSWSPMLALPSRCQSSLLAPPLTAPLPQNSTPNSSPFRLRPWVTPTTQPHNTRTFLSWVLPVPLDARGSRPLPRPSRPRPVHFPSTLGPALRGPAPRSLGLRPLRGADRGTPRLLCGASRRALSFTSAAAGVRVRARAAPSAGGGALS
jgi:hypothetical protein